MGDDIAGVSAADRQRGADRPLSKGDGRPGLEEKLPGRADGSSVHADGSSVHADRSSGHAGRSSVGIEK
jgi:hypothetical protein